MEILTGKILGGRYRVETFLGRGGMADVYQVWDQQRAAHLALKILHDDLAEDVVFLRRFKREAQTLERLQHPNIVRFYGLEEAEGQAFILMDFIDGLTLRKEIFLNKGGLRPGRALAIMRPVCAALHYAHQMGMVHCDLKPANIIIHRNGTVYLADFGIARVTGARTQAGASAGTPAYMSPETLRGDEPTPAADIYALGVVLFEMLTGGERPFAGQSPYIGSSGGPQTGSLTERIGWEKENLSPPPPGRFNPSVAPELQSVTLRCLERRPSDRYASVLEMLQALEQAAHSQEDALDVHTLTAIHPHDEAGRAGPAWLPAREPSTPAPAPAPFPTVEEAPRPQPAPAAQPPSQPSAAGRPDRLAALRRHAFSALLLAAALIVTALAGAAVLRQNTPAQAAVSPSAVSTSTAASTPTPTASQPPPTAPTAAPSPTLPTGSPPPGAPAAPTAVSPPAAPTPSGGSSQIAFASDRSGSVQVWVMDADHREDRQQVTGETGGACQPDWSPDGKALAYITPCNGPRLTYPGAQIKIIDLASGEIRAPRLQGGAFEPDWSPDGNTIVYTAYINDRTEIHALDVRDFSTRVLSKRGSKSLNPRWSPDGAHIAFTSDDKDIDEIWLMRADGGSQEVLTQAGPLKYFSRPSWSPDGRQVLAALRVYDSATPVQSFVLVDRAEPGRGETRLIAEPLRMEDGSFSPDGEWVLFWSVMQGNNMEILRVNRSGELVQVTNHQERDFHPAWSPR